VSLTFLDLQEAEEYVKQVNAEGQTAKITRIPPNQWKVEVYLFSGTPRSERYNTVWKEKEQENLLKKIGPKYLASAGDSHSFFAVGEGKTYKQKFDTIEKVLEYMDKQKGINEFSLYSKYSGGPGEGGFLATFIREDGEFKRYQGEDNDSFPFRNEEIIEELKRIPKLSQEGFKAEVHKRFKPIFEKET